MNKLKIIFLGSSEFGIPSLKTLIENKFNIVAVVTIPDKPSGRGKKLTASPIKKYAESLDIPILQPEKLKDEHFLEKLKSLEANLQIVVAFKMLPKIIWNMPRYGTINLHASLLPEYRGAAPINWAIINGENKTGVTTFFLDEKMDTGKIAFSEEEIIYNDDNVEILYNRLKIKGSKLILKTVQGIQNNTCPKVTQFNINSKLLKKAPKIYKEDCKIIWDQEAEKIHDFIRGLSPKPGAWTILNNKRYNILETRLQNHLSEDDNKVLSTPLRPGEIYIESKRLFIKSNDDPIEILRIQAEGKKVMESNVFLQGNKL